MAGGGEGVAGGVNRELSLAGAGGGDGLRGTGEGGRGGEGGGGLVSRVT